MHQKGQCIQGIQKVLIPTNKEKHQYNKKALSILLKALQIVGMTGFEPATPSSRTTYATGLRYIPNNRLQKYIFFMVCKEG